MKAAVIEEFAQPLVIKEVPTPQPGPGEILVRIQASGICNGDIDAQCGNYPGLAKPDLPRIPGHRGAGVIEIVGANVRRLRVGDRVGIPLVHSACGSCFWCLEGRPMLCKQVRLTGYQADGCYAEYVKADANYVGKIPAGLAIEEAAHLTCTGVTAWGALKEAGLQPGQWCMVWGLGAVGQYTVQYAVGFGLRVIAVSAFDDALQTAKANGAEYALNSETDDPVALIRKQLGGAHAALCFSKSAAPYAQCLNALRQRGKLVVVGLPLAELPVPLFPLAVRQIGIQGSFVGSRNDLENAYAMALRNNITLASEDVALENVNDALERIRAGNSASRITLRP